MTEPIDLKAIQQELEAHVQQLSYGQHPTELYAPISYLMGLGGKRIRPLLTLLAYNLYRPDYQRVLTPACAVEVFHNFTLMHDDIMDQAPLRRGKPTVHEKWNANTAILSGDVMLVRAYDMLLHIAPDKLGHCIRLFNQTAAEVCEGQQLDMNFEALEKVSESDYLEMIRLKTAVLLGFALQFGAILAGAPDSDCEKLYNFGVNIGIGFQLKDDLLDVYADKALFGKQVGGDIISNKKTYLLIKAKELATAGTAGELASWIGATAFDKQEKVTQVTRIYDALGIQALTERKMHAYFEKGFAQLDELHPLRVEGMEMLLNVTKNLVNREK
jgi:geranylgeranyl diphosphate synthase type II